MRKRAGFPPFLVKYMNKIKILSKEQYAYLNNLEPEIYDDTKEISKWLNLKDFLKRGIVKGYYRTGGRTNPQIIIK